jgi:hypothetical protein
MSIVSDKKILTSKNNRYNNILTNGETYTGTPEINFHTQIMTTLLTTNSAILYIDISPDSSNWHTYQYTITAGTFDQQILTCGIMYVRIRVENTSNTDNTIILNTYFGSFGSAQQTLLNSSTPANQQASIVKSILQTEHLNGEYLPVKSYFNRAVNVSLINPMSAFGELLISDLYSYAQLQFSYYEGDISTNNIFTIFRNNSSSASVKNENLILSSGCNFGDYSIVQSKKFMRYNPGQGIRFRGSMLFSPLRPGFQQAIGFGDKANGFYVYNSGTSMSILKRTDGSYEIHKLEIAGSIANSDGLITIILNSQPNYITVSNGDTAIEIINNIVSNPLIRWNDLGWEIFTQGITLYFKSINPGSFTGSFTFTSTVLGITDSFERISIGSNYTELEVEQINWNDKCNGTTFLPEIDFSLGNVLELNFQWLGYGKIIFNIENPNNGFLQEFHTFLYSNANGKPSISNPNGYIIAGSQNTTPDLIESFTTDNINTVENTITTPNHGFTTNEFVCYDNNSTNGVIPTTFTKTFDGSDSSIVLISGQNAIKITGHTFKNTEQVVYSAGGGTQINGLIDGNIYYVIYYDDDTIQLALSLDNVETYTSIPINGVGTGTSHSFSSFRYYIHVVDEDTIQLKTHFDDISAITLSATGTRLIKLRNCYAINIDGSSINNGSIITKTGHGLQNYEAIKYINYSGGDDISGLIDGEIYYVLVIDEDNFSLTEYKTGSAITLNAGTGNEHHFLTVSTFSTASLGLFNEGIIRRDNLQTYSIEGRTTTVTVDDTEFPMLALFVEKEYYNKNNNIPIKITNLSFSYNKESATDKEVTAKFKIYINPVFSSYNVANTFTDIETGVSVCSYSTLSSTDRIQSGKVVFNTYTQIGGITFDGNDIELQPGDMLVITGARTLSNKNIILNCNITWNENF